MLYRPVSQMLQIFVLPEIGRRVRSGAIADAGLPLHVHQFRVVQPGPGHSVELNEQVQLRVSVKPRKAMKVGQTVHLDDIDVDSAVLGPPIVDGMPRPYFLLRSAFLNLQIAFDFTQSESDETLLPTPLPIAEFVQMREFLKTVKPVEKFRQLAGINWPPAPGYFPNVIAYTHQHPGKLQEPEFADTVSAAYDVEFWQRKMDLWREAHFFPGRLRYIRKAVDEYFEGDWISSIYVLVPQFEGIVRDYLTAAGESPENGFKDMVGQLGTLVFSRSILLFPLPVLELILGFLRTGDVLEEHCQDRRSDTRDKQARYCPRSLHRLRDAGHGPEVPRAARRARAVDTARQDGERQSVIRSGENGRHGSGSIEPEDSRTTQHFGRHQGLFRGNHLVSASYLHATVASAAGRQAPCTRRGLCLRRLRPLQERLYMIGHLLFFCVFVKPHRATEDQESDDFLN